MNLKARLSVFLLLTTTLSVYLVRPVMAMNIFEYGQNVYSPAIYDDPNINLQKHIKETIEIIPWAIIDTYILGWVPGGVKCSLFATSGTGLDSCLKSAATASTNIPTPIAQAFVLAHSAPTLGFPSTILAIRSTLSSFSPITSVHAQGAGYQSLSANIVVISLWTSIRNLTYLLSAVILIIMGLMVMFRVKISPQATITIEQAIPKLAITLLLITFSFAIAGLAIDLIGLGNALIVVLIDSAKIPQTDQLFNTIHGLCSTLSSSTQQCNIASWTKDRALYWPPGLLNDGLFGNVISLSLVAILIVIWKTFAVISAFSSVGGVLGALIGLIAIVLMIIILLFNILRVLFTMTKVYAQIIILTVFSPLILLGGAIPGWSGGFGPWFSELLQNVLAFPLTSGLFLLGITILLAVPAEIQFNNGWSTALIGGSPDLALIFVGFVVLSMAPKAPDILKSFFSKKPFSFETAMGEAIGPAWAIGTAKTRYQTGVDAQGNPVYQTGWIGGNIASAIRDRNLRGLGGQLAQAGQNIAVRGAEKASGFKLTG